MTNQQFLTENGEPPAGYKIVKRSCCVRLGPNLRIHTDTNHASLGVVEISVENNLLKVVTDFEEGELILSPTASVDATLAAKGVIPGTSGGSAVTLVAIYSARNLPYGTNSVRPAWSLIPPQSAVFDSNIDNLWLNLDSLKPIE